MASKKIFDINKLEITSQINDSDLVSITQSGVDRKITIDDLGREFSINIKNLFYYIKVMLQNKFCLL